MAESTDKKTRKIAEKRVEPGKEFESYQEAQNQLLAIQAEQQQNLALQANDAMNVQQQNQTLAQAAEVMAMDNLNPATQGMLAGYGLNQPRVIKQSNTQRQGPNNITINNTTINNASGPVQGREISIRPQEAGQSKFKAWLTNVFARQDAQWQKQNQEYARRESSLTRNANKMMRKLEGLGKEIGNVVDPRKQAQRAQNSTMNLLKALGLVYFAKKLPDILGFFNNAEEKIRGWIGEIGNKIKSGIGNIKIDLSELGDKIWNDRETGYLNKVLQKISDFIFERAEYASRQTGSLTGWFDLPDGDKIITWLKLFLGGQRAGVGIQKGNIKSELYNDNNVVSETTENYLNTDSRMGVDRTGNRIRLSEDNMYGVSSATGKTEISEDEYKNWLKKNDKKASEQTAKEFLDEKDFIYTGEAVILMEKVYKNPAHVLNKEQDFFAGRLRTDSIYGSIAASHDLISEVRRGYGSQGVNKTWVYDSGTLTGGRWENRNASMKAIMYYLDLLYQRALVGGSVIFEDAFNLITDTSLRKSLLESEDAKKITVILIKQPMNDVDKRRYWKKGTMGLSDYYKKLARTDHGDINMDEALPLKEKDFKGNINPFKKQWTFYSVSRVGFGEIIEKMTGSGVDNIFSKQSQINAASYINKNAADFKEGNENFHYNFKNWKDYETAIEEVNNYNREKAIYEEEKSKKEGEKFLSKRSTDLEIEEKHDEDSKYSMPIVNMTEDTGLRLGGKPDPVTGEKGPGNIKNVTNAFGGDGTLTSNFKERREYGINKDNRRVADNGKEYRYHYGVDLNNSEGGDVRFPTKGKIKGSTYISKSNKEDGTSHIDIDNGDGTTTVFYHTKLADRFIDKDGKPIEGIEVLPGEVIGTSEHYSAGAHIHLAVKNEKGVFINPLKYFQPKLKDLKTTYQPDEGNRGDLTPEMQAISDKRELLSEFTDKLKTEIQKNIINPEFSGQNYFMNGITSKKTLTPKEFSSQRDSEEKEMLKVLVEQVSLITQSSGYTASAISPLVDNMNAGFTMVTEATSKSGGPTNLTPHEPQLEMNQV